MTPIKCSEDITHNIHANQYKSDLIPTPLKKNPARLIKNTCYIEILERYIMQLGVTKVYAQTICLL